MIVLIVGLVIAVGVAAYFIFRKKDKTKLALTPLPKSDAQFPRIFQAWSGLDANEASIAKHDLVWGAEPLVLKQRFGTEFTPESIEATRGWAIRLRSLNPSIKLIRNIGCNDAFLEEMPAGKDWWWRNTDGTIKVLWAEGNTLAVDYRLPEVQEVIVDQAVAGLALGFFDGVFHDWWMDDEHHLAIIQKLRQAIGPEMLIICNNNGRLSPLTARYMNGCFMEISSPPNWGEVQSALDWNERNMATPRVNCLEIQGTRGDLRTMRAATCLALTRSNGYVLFSDNNSLPIPDHQHDWYPFWDADLGKPTSSTLAAGGVGSRREFERGTAVFNPPEGRPISLTFPEPRTSAATGSKSSEHVLPSGDGGIYLR